MLTHAFVVAPTGDYNQVAGVIYPVDDAQFLLPGGEIESLEDPRIAVIRQATKQGWAIACPLVEIHRAQVSDHNVVWFASPGATRLYPQWATLRAVPVEIDHFLVEDTFGSKDALKAYMEWYLSPASIEAGFRQP